MPTAAAGGGVESLDPATPRQEQLALPGGGLARTLPIAQHEAIRTRDRKMRYVCPHCVRDVVLAAVVTREAVCRRCDFCGRTESGPIAAETQPIIDKIARCVQRDWIDLSEPIVRPGPSQTEWPWSILTIDELLEEEGHPLASDAFGDFVRRAFRGTSWSAPNPQTLREAEALGFSWELFKETVKHEARFLFLSLDEPRPAEAHNDALWRGGALLRRLAELIRHFELVVDLPAGHRFVRIRCHRSDEAPSGAAELGTPPRANARQGRMSPAGIPMFYGAEDEATARAETIGCAVRPATLGTFETTAPTRIVDLDQLPPVPSLFDERPDAVAVRGRLGFLAGFRADVSARVEHEELVHVDYVPTQVVGEYLRHMFRDRDGQPVDGVAWESAQRPGGRSVALFVSNERCVEASADAPRDGLALRLVRAERLHP